MNVDVNKPFSFDDSSGTNNKDVNVKYRQIQSDCNKFFINDIVRERNKLPPSLVQCSTIHSFKHKLDLQQGLR